MIFAKKSENNAPYLPKRPLSAAMGDKGRFRQLHHQYAMNANAPVAAAEKSAVRCNRCVGRSYFPGLRSNPGEFSRKLFSLSLIRFCPSAISRLPRSTSSCPLLRSLSADFTRFSPALTRFSPVATNFVPFSQFFAAWSFRSTCACSSVACCLIRSPVVGMLAQPVNARRQRLIPDTTNKFLT